MNLPFLNKTYYQKLKSSVEDEYFDFIEQIREDIEEGADSDLLSPEFQSFLKEEIFSEKLNQFHPLHFYWINLIDGLVYLLGLHEEKLSEDVFDFWEATEYAEIFLKFETEFNNSLKSSRECVCFLESQIQSFYYLHIKEEDLHTDLPNNYNVIPELGDSENRIFIGKNGKAINFTKPIDSFPLIPFLNLNFKAGNFEIDQEKEVQRLNLESLSSTVQGFEVRTTEGKFESEKEIQTQRISKALDIIKKTDNELYELLRSFTKVIIPVDEPGIVSYSMQNLPGYSSINLFERDDIDLIDDLLHENGHHFLNYHLNTDELIIEDDEKIYYSPWRRSLRPIRGIYHATCTFFWAYYLFMSLSEKSLALFNEEQKVKVLRRFLEEKLMVEYTFEDLKHAFNEGKVTESGFAFIKFIKDFFQSNKTKHEKALNTLKELSSDDYKSVNELTDHLVKQREHYQI
ncbi:MAG: hypothetical protein GY909_11260 [Oligoflexia bacterium]|nr:hypothetical protein [Oligoflexia bacterium]